jgi:hypothetical protein
MRGYPGVQAFYPDDKPAVPPSANQTDRAGETGEYKEKETRWTYISF